MKHDPANIIIAVDGTAASGKGTLARRLAADLAFAYLDTGKLYRLVGMQVLADGGSLGNADDAVAAVATIRRDFDPRSLENKALLSDCAGDAASQVAAVPAVRAALLDLQRAFAAQPPDAAKGAVLDGRDIGTVICPDATLKLFIDAAMPIRAERRFKELQSQGISVTYDAVLADMLERDQRDSSRTVAPMKPADDAIIVDTSHLDADAVFEKARAFIREKCGL